MAKKWDKIKKKINPQKPQANYINNNMMSRSEFAGAFWQNITAIVSTAFVVCGSLAAVFLWFSSVLAQIEKNTEHVESEPERAAQRQEIKETVIRIEEQLKNSGKNDKKIQRMLRQIAKQQDINE